ncbi:MAG: ATP-binding protein [Bacteroidota bacterium]
MWAKSQLYGFTASPEYIDPKRLVDGTVSIFQSEIDKKNLRVVNTLSSEAKVYADPSLAKLIVRNLLTNAIKFSHENTHIVVNGLSEGVFLKMTITDEGIGISDDQQEKLLKGAVQSLGTSSTEMGTGLGLMLCKEFVDMHNGRMGIDSKVGKGTSVWFTLPLTMA